MDTIKRQRPVISTLPNRRRRLGPTSKDLLWIVAAIAVTFFSCYGLMAFVQELAK